MTLQELQTFINKSTKDNPEIKFDILDFYSLCISEIEEGGSEMHEVELCMNSIEELIKENKN